VAEGDKVKVKQGSGSAALTAAIDKKLPENVVRVAAAHASTAALGGMFGAIVVEKA
jgi:NADH-quinone oxidoreductase subunit G